MTPQEIKFEDIRKDDVIRTVRTFDNGYVSSFEGKATRNFGDDWYNGDSSVFCVASSKYAVQADTKFYLIERVEPLDHIIIFSRPGSDEMDQVYSSNVLTESYAKGRADRYNSDDTAGYIYKAVKVDL